MSLVTRGLDAIDALLTPRSGVSNRSRVTPRYRRGQEQEHLPGMIESFAQQFDALLKGKKPPPPTVAASSPENTPKSPGDKSIKWQVLSCRQVASLVIGATELLEVQRMAREHCRRPCDTLRSTMLRGAAAGAAGGGGQAASASLEAYVAEGEAAALASVGGATASGASPRVASPRASPRAASPRVHRLQGGSGDELIEAICARLMRSVRAQLGESLDAEIRLALGRRVELLTDMEEAETLANRMAFQTLEMAARAHVQTAVGRARERARKAATQLLEAPLGASSSAEVVASWGLKRRGVPLPSVVLRAVELPSPSTPAAADTPESTARSASGAPGEPPDAAEAALAVGARSARTEEETLRERLVDLKLHVDAYHEAWCEEFGCPPTEYDLPRSVRKMRAEAERLEARLEGGAPSGAGLGSSAAGGADDVSGGSVSRADGAAAHGGREARRHRHRDHGSHHGSHHHGSHGGGHHHHHQSRRRHRSAGRSRVVEDGAAAARPRDRTKPERSSSAEGRRPRRAAEIPAATSNEGVDDGKGVVPRGARPGGSVPRSPLPRSPLVERDLAERDLERDLERWMERADSRIVSPSSATKSKPARVSAASPGGGADAAELGAAAGRSPGSKLGARRSLWSADESGAICADGDRELVVAGFTDDSDDSEDADEGLRLGSLHGPSPSASPAKASASGSAAAAASAGRYAAASKKPAAQKARPGAEHPSKAAGPSRGLRDSLRIGSRRRARRDPAERERDMDLVLSV